MSLTVLDPGLQSSVQGHPYHAQRHRAVPQAGAADPLSLALANWCVGNAHDAPAIEITLTTARFRADCPMAVAVSGAAQSLSIDDRTVEPNRTLHLRENDILTVHAPPTGCRSYLGVAAGFAVQELLGAFSTCLTAGFGGYHGRPLRIADRIELIDDDAFTGPRIVPDAYRQVFTGSHLLRAVSGAEFQLFPDQARRVLYDTAFRVGARSDRVGIELESPGRELAHDLSIDSSAVFPGTVQCPPSGRPFLLGPDAQTTGGYPRIAQIIRPDRHRIGQLRPGDTLRLVSVDPQQAHDIYRQKLALWRALIADLRLD